MLSFQERQRNNLAHARWRVEFLLSILDADRAEPVHGPEWKAKEAEYLHQLAEAQVELDCVEWRMMEAGGLSDRAGVNGRRDRRFNR